jgi:hypothetical protein
MLPGQDAKGPVEEQVRPQPERTAAMKDVLMSEDCFRGDIEIPPRGLYKLRPPVKF